ncbi:MAG: CBS domain-containing protein [Candidatus Bathyarchaeota archaeon]|nr:CBS domain-containing protein [Candidatus Bathyarchaeota archaeon]MCX8176739.1 CBS domain-containing protein [Candidatus Bathyarchaeota archaeon]MDW8193268.1 CBS domain-containing protein [Nitrososphaerota archaeon]
MLPQIDEIARKRKMLGLTQKELAKLAGVSQSLIAKLESGKINPSYDKVKAIFDALEKLETNLDVRVSDVLHNKVVGIQKNEPVAKAVKLMVEYGFSQLPVFDGESVVGSISEKTLMRKLLSTKDFTKISLQPVECIMEEGFPQVGKNTPIKVVSSLLDVYPAVLVSEKGKIVGIITKADLLKVLL